MARILRVLLGPRLPPSNAERARKIDAGHGDPTFMASDVAEMSLICTTYPQYMYGIKKELSGLATTRFFAAHVLRSILAPKPASRPVAREKRGALAL